MPQFRKKPVVIEARVFTGDNTTELFEWGDAYTVAMGHRKAQNELIIATLEGEMTASVGDWIIRERPATS